VTTDATVTPPGQVPPERSEPETSTPVPTATSSNSEQQTTDVTTARARTEESIPTGSSELERPSGSGNIDDIVPTEKQSTIPEVPLDETAQFGGRISAEVTSIDRIEGEARLPGEVAGSALAVHVRLDNGSSKRLDVSGVTVTVEDRDGTPSSPLSTDPAEPFAETIDPGAATEAVYVFAFEDSQPQPITVGINYSADEPVAFFVGSV
jgi:hypothetical protein